MHEGKWPLWMVKECEADAVRLTRRVLVRTGDKKCTCNMRKIYLLRGCHRNDCEENSNNASREVESQQRPVNCFSFPSAPFRCPYGSALHTSNFLIPVLLHRFFAFENISYLHILTDTTQTTYTAVERGTHIPDACATAPGTCDTVKAKPFCPHLLFT